MKDYELLQKYLDSALNDDELKAFNLLYAQDISFRNQVDQYKDIIQGIRLSEITKIRNTIGSIHHETLSEISDNFAFESDLSKALRLKQRSDIKNEILNVKTEMMKTTQSTKNEPSQNKVVRRSLYRMIPLAASVLVIISLGIYLFTRNDDIDTEKINKVYAIIKLGSQSAGIGDPNQSKNMHQLQVFELLDRNKMDSARIVQESYYTNQAKNADYFVMNGLIYFKAGKNALAKKSFGEGISHGDQCLSKLLLALMNDKGITETNKIVLTIRENAVCQSSELVNAILKELKW